MIYTIPTTVKEAAQILDDAYPNWWEKINTKKLDMTNSGLCILGQLYNNFSNGHNILFNKTCQNNSPYGSKANNKEWLEEINLRLNPPPASLDFWTAMKLLTQGKKVRRKSWSKEEYWEYQNNLNGGVQHFKKSGVWSIDAPLGCHLLNDWELYEEPLTFSQLKAGDKFTVRNSNTILTKGDRETIAVYDNYKLVTVSHDAIVERVIL